MFGWLRKRRSAETQQSTIYDVVLWLKSNKTGRLFPTVQFTADTDMATNGWESLTSTERSELVIVEVSGDEYGALVADRPEYVTMVEQRVNAALGRTDLRCVPLWRPPGVSFRDYLKTGEPLPLKYRDIYDADSFAKEVSLISRHEFERNGGKVIVLA